MLSVFSLASCYLTPSTPLEILPVSRLGNLSYPMALPCKRPSRNTFLDTDTRWAIEDVHPKERVTQFGTPGYSCEYTANFIEGNHQPPLRRTLAPQGLGHLPDALSQSKELPTRRSLTNPFPSNQRLPQCNPRHLTLDRELIHPLNLRQALRR